MNHFLQAAECVQRVVSGTDSERIVAVRELTRLGVVSRRSILPRGNPLAAAINRLPNESSLVSLVGCLEAAQDDFLCQLMAALSEWGDEKALRAMQKRMERVNREDRIIWSYYIGAVGCIGGPVAVQILTGMVDEENSCYSHSLMELVTGGCVDLSEGYTSEQMEAWQQFCQAT